MLVRRYSASLSVGRDGSFPLEIEVHGEVSPSADGSEWVVRLDGADAAMLSKSEQEEAKDAIAAAAHRHGAVW